MLEETRFQKAPGLELPRAWNSPASSSSRKASSLKCSEQSGPGPSATVSLIGSRRSHGTTRSPDCRNDGGKLTVNPGTGKGRWDSALRKGSQPACPQADMAGARRDARVSAASVRRGVRMALGTEWEAGGVEAGGSEIAGDEWVAGGEGVGGVTTVEEWEKMLIDMRSYAKD
ncbi:MAG: hypothetical protein LBT40_17040 [Deltaproteobacteria bacterium]|jgi:hypothetical protein|nr:hypothetical protein [Deltaproteobacteria bacterium]